MQPTSATPSCLPAVTDHGVPEDLVARTFDQQRAFFGLPLQDKMTIAANKYYRHEQL